MPRRGTKQAINSLQDVDDLVFLITGRRIKNLVTRGLELFGEDMKKKVIGEESRSDSPDDPYNILGVRLDASDIVVKAAFRSLSREYHPDTSAHPDPRFLQLVKESYDKIMYERHGG